ncbi:1170_t:CDS:2, partial [Acaulospora morrowiae]
IYITSSTSPSKPKNARSKRALQKREPKVKENVKTALFIRGTSTTEIVNEALSDLCRLKKPDSITFNKKNEIRPFEDDTTLEFLCQKNDASLFVIGSNSKKRPNNLVFARMFDGQVLDMIEVGIEWAVPMSQFKTPKCTIGMKPLFIFTGSLFETSQPHKVFKNMLLDFFQGKVLKSFDLTGIEYVISVTAIGSPLPDESNVNPSRVDGKIFFRVYTINMKKSGERTPRVELEEMGPHYNFFIRRTKFAKDEVYKQATRIPKSLKPKKEKNIDVNEMGDVVGRIHVGKQDLSKLQTRKMKGLKREAREDDSDDEKPTKKLKN